MPPDSPRVKFFAAVLFREEHAFDRGLAALAEFCGAVAWRGEPHPFTFSDYYEAEMGGGLSRVVVAFADTAAPEALVATKLAAATVEQRLAVEGRRTVNVDVGYVDLHKVVLASFKPRGTKLYLGRGVWADMTLLYEHGAFRPLPWSFPDFRAGTYDADLTHVRELLKGELRSGADAVGDG